MTNSNSGVCCASGNADGMPSRRGLLLVVAGPSGVGKGTIIAGVLQRHPEVRVSVSCTTRPPRPGEVHGRDYFFVSREEFERMRDSHELLESAHVHGDHWYGTPRKPVEEAIGSGHDIILEIDYQGARSVRQLFPSDTVLVFVAPPSWGALLDRLHRRHTEHPSQVQRRLASARSEFAHMGMFDYLIVNDCLQQSVDELEAILCAERLKLERAQWQTFQARLLAEADGQNAGGPVGGGGHAQP